MVKPVRSSVGRWRDSIAKEFQNIFKKYLKRTGELVKFLAAKRSVFN